MRSNNIDRFVGYRTVAMATDHTDAEGYTEITSWPTLDDCLIGAWDIASKSTWRKNMISAPLPIKWVVGQVMVLTEGGIGHWRTIEVIVLNYDGTRILHSISDKSGIPFDCNTPDDDFGPQRFNMWSDDNYIAPNVEIDQTTGQFETYEDYKARCAADYPILEQIPYMEPGMSQQIRMTLAGKLGWPMDVADQAVIEWKKLDNGSYGWIVQMPNGAVYFLDDHSGLFVAPQPRAQLTEPQVKELTIQLEYFTDLSYESDDLDVCINASVFALAIMRILG